MGMAQSGYLLFIETAATLLLLIYPTLMLVIKGGMNGVFLCTLLLAFAVLVVRPNGMKAVVWRREWEIYALAMVSMAAAILISQSYHQSYAAHPHDAASRYWLAIPVFLLLLRLRPSVFAVLQFAFPVAAIIGLLLAKDMGGRTGISTLDVIHFGDFELTLGVLSLFCIDWFGNDRWPLRTLKILGFIAGLAASFASGSRGGWLAIPVFVAIFIYFKAAWRSPRAIAITAIAGTLAAGVLTATLYYSPFHQRMTALVTDVTAYDQGNSNTSTGIRWQLYKAAADVFSRHPIFGVGPEGFALEMQPMMEAGKVTPDAAALGRGEVHNDILSKAAGMGVFGLLAMLAVYFVPFGLFWQATKSAYAQVRRAGVLGITFVSGFIVFGLTVECLNLTMATAFYSFTVAVLLAACYNIHHGEAAHHKSE